MVDGSASIFLHRKNAVTPSPSEGKIVISNSNQFPPNRETKRKATTLCLRRIGIRFNLKLCTCLTFSNSFSSVFSSLTSNFEQLLDDILLFFSCSRLVRNGILVAIPNRNQIRVSDKNEMRKICEKNKSKQRRQRKTILKWKLFEFD